MAISNYTIGEQYASLASPSVAQQPPLTMANKDVDSELLLHAVNRKLTIEATLNEIMDELGADVVSGITDKPSLIPNAIFMKLTAPAVGSRTNAVAMLEPAKGAPRMGDAEQQKGYERPMGLKYFKTYYNEFSYAIAGSEWGVHFNDANVFDLFSYIQPNISKLFAEIRGKWIREATLRTISTPLTKSPVSLTAAWNRNIFMANLGFGSQPTYDSTANTYTAAIHTAFDAAATGTSAVNMNIDLDYLLALQHYAANIKKIRHLKIGGKDTYVVLLPSSQIHLLLSNDEGQLGRHYEQVTALTKEEMSYPNVVTRVGKLLIFEDQRNPVVTDNGTGTLTPAYCMPGNEDARNIYVWASDSNEAYDVGALYGEAALYEWKVRDLHFETDRENYGQIYGKGAFGESGIGSVEWDDDSGWAATAGHDDRANYGSISLFFSAPSIVVTA